MVYAIRHKESGKFTCYSGSNKIPRDDRGFVEEQFAHTLATEASARASLKELISSRAHYVDYTPKSKEYARVKALFTPAEHHKWASLYVEANEMEILEVSFQILRVVE